MNTRRRMLCLAVWGALSACVHAEDWPQFLGPHGDGHSQTTGLPTTWSKDENVAWRRELPGEGWSSPVVVAGKVYLTAAVPIPDQAGDYSLRTLAFDAQSGEPLWDREIFLEEGSKAPKIHSKNSHASPTPIVAEDRLYVHFGHQGCACLTLGGDEIWKRSDIRYAPVHGNGGSQVLVGGTLIFSCDGASDPFVIGIQAADGKDVWRYKRPGKVAKTFAFATPAAIDVAGVPQVIIPGADSVAALRPQTGEEIWRVTYDGYSVIPRPLFGHGLVFMSTGYDSPVLLAIDPTGAGDVTETHVPWQNKRGAPNTPSLLLVDAELYLVSDRGVVTCLDAKTGEQHWQQRVGGNYSSSPIYADGKIYLQSEEGAGLVIKPGKKYEKLAENGFGERSLATYAVADGVLFIRTAAALYRVAAAR